MDIPALFRRLKIGISAVKVPPLQIAAIGYFGPASLQNDVYVGLACLGISQVYPFKFGVVNAQVNRGIILQRNNVIEHRTYV
jgi:hypothetical protein